MQLSVPTAQVSLFQWAVVKTETHAWSMYREYVKSLALNVTSISYCSPQGLENIKEEKEEVCKRQVGRRIPPVSWTHQGIVLMNP